MTILEDIINNKRREVALLNDITDRKELEKGKLFTRQTVSLSEYLLDEEKTKIIAEFKRKSPSKGIINSESLISEVIPGYIREGASAVSILTDTRFFGGSNDDILVMRDKCHCPILRKDFIIDELQVIESKSIGADAILLIAAVLDTTEIKKLAGLARSLGMEVLLEIHKPDELDKVNHHINIIGVNNRDLKTFEVNTDISVTLAEMIPHGFLKISESGISSSLVIKKLKALNYNGFLIGEKFMSHPDPPIALAEFVMDLK
jgi:indole-3-glycerol phosphate synthase